MSQSYTVTVTLDPDTYQSLAAAAGKAGETVEAHASKQLGADLDKLSEWVPVGAGPAEPPKKTKAAAKK